MEPPSLLPALPRRRFATGLVSQEALRPRAEATSGGGGGGTASIHSGGSGAAEKAAAACADVGTHTPQKYCSPLCTVGLYAPLALWACRWPSAPRARPGGASLPWRSGTGSHAAAEAAAVTGYAGSPAWRSVTPPRVRSSPIVTRSKHAPATVCVSTSVSVSSSSSSPCVCEPTASLSLSPSSATAGSAGTPLLRTAPAASPDNTDEGSDENDAQLSSRSPRPSWDLEEEGLMNDDV